MTKRQHVAGETYAEAVEERFNQESGGSQTRTRFITVRPLYSDASSLKKIEAE